MIRIHVPLAVAMLAAALATPARAGAAVTTPSAQESPNDPTSSELVVQPKRWDGKEIAFTGEVITEAQERGRFSWIHINDDAYYLKNVEEGATLGGFNSGHAVWLPTELVESITYFGDYKHEGDVVTVRGTFNAACGQHGGDMDIHATSLDVKIVGHPVREPVKPVKALVGVLLAALAAMLWAMNRRAANRELRGLFEAR